MIFLMKCNLYSKIDFKIRSRLLNKSRFNLKYGVKIIFNIGKMSNFEPKCQFCQKLPSYPFERKIWDFKTNGDFD